MCAVETQAARAVKAPMLDGFREYVENVPFMDHSETRGMVNAGEKGREGGRGTYCSLELGYRSR